MRKWKRGSGRITPEPSFVSNFDNPLGQIVTRQPSLADVSEVVVVKKMDWFGRETSDACGRILDRYRILLSLQKSTEFIRHVHRVVIQRPILDCKLTTLDTITVFRTEPDKAPYAAEMMTARTEWDCDKQLPRRIRVLHRKTEMFSQPSEQVPNGCETSDIFCWPKVDKGRTRFEYMVESGKANEGSSGGGGTSRSLAWSKASGGSMSQSR